MLGDECYTHKACYPSMAEANRAIANIKRHGDRKNSGRPVRTYCCPSCRYYHTTSMSEWGDAE
jgi:hypothetical protein